MPARLLSESALRERVAPEIFRRGEEYLRRGAISALVSRGDVLHAEVEGSDVDPYLVTISRTGTGDVEARCTCPSGYEWGGWCKHIVATLLAAEREPESVEEQVPLAELISGLDREQLLALVRRLADEQPALYDRVVALLPRLGKGTSDPGAPPSLPLDPNSVRRRVRAALRPLRGMRESEAYWRVGSSVEDVQELLRDVEALIATGEARAALEMLEPITDEIIESWAEVDDSDGYIASHLDELGALWTEAILSADLTPSERESWEGQLDVWDAAVEEYQPVFGAALEALRQGWTTPALQRVLQGLATTEQLWPEGAPWYADELTRARLTVLGRRGEWEAALNLGFAAGLHAERAHLLVQLGRVAEAVALAEQHFTQPAEALALARQLLEQEHPDEALQVGEHALPLGGSGRTELALWLRDVAAERGRGELALRAAEAAYRADPTLDTYLAAQQLAGDAWGELREPLLTHAATANTYSLEGPVDVLLHEGRVAEALDRVRGITWNTALLARVVDAAIPVLPERALPIARAQAERIMDEGRAAGYDEAITWLRRARDAQRALGQAAEWEAYLAGLIETHRRKYKLRPMLEGLRR